MLDQYNEIVLADFEFIEPEGESVQRVVCGVFSLLRAGKTIKLFEHELEAEPPFSTGPDTLYISFNVVAEIGCHLKLNWPTPQRVLDLYVEYLAQLNTFREGDTEPPKASLISALVHFGVDTVGAEEKRSMIDLILTGGPWSAEQRKAILDYCESDVRALERLLPRMLPTIDLPRALLRGRYMCAAAAIKRNGIPLDGGHLRRLRRHWQAVQGRLIDEVDDAGVYDENRSFSAARFGELLVKHDIAWPRHADGKLDLRKETFRDMADSGGAQAIAPLVRLRNQLSGLRLGIGLTVGADDKNRTSLWPFRSTTGRNQPSNASFIFGCARWLRGLIRPPEGCAIAYLDWKQQEFGIAAALSGDEAMMAAYRSGDPYLAFAKQAGAVPATATKQTHARERDLYKLCILATQYGQGSKSLALRIARPGANMAVEIIARELLENFDRSYSTFRRWNQRFVDTVMFRGEARTVFGWPARVLFNPNPRAIANFPMQGNGAEMMRIACCLGVERGVEVAASVHDAVVIAAPIGAIDGAAVTMQAAMAEASRAVLDGFELGTDAKIVRYPDRFMDERLGSREMWDHVWKLVEQEEMKGES
jgi:hypothetical protein